MSRVIRGLGALVVLLCGIAGVPAALLALGPHLPPATLSWQTVRLALFTPDDGTVLLGLVTFVGWAAWLIFALSVGTELLALLSRSRIRLRLPGLSGPQRLAAGLLVSVIAMIAISPVAQAPPVATSTVAPEGPPPALTEPAEATTATVAADATGSAVAEDEPTPVSAAGATGAAAPGRVIHLVEVGDDLWSLAEHYYGDGREWRAIATANPRLLTGGPDRLQPGWRLTISGEDAPLNPAGERRVMVRRGDTLAQIADRELGSAQEWPRIYRLNRFQLTSPDDLAVGSELRLPTESGSRSTEVPAPIDRVESDEAGAGSAGSDQPGGQVQEQTRLPPASATPHPSPRGSAAPRADPTLLPPSGEHGPAPGAEHASDGFVVPLAGVGGLLAAGLLGGLAVRRRVQLQARGLGRRIPQPPVAAQAVESAMGRRQQPLGLRTLDRASRAIAASCRHTGSPLPPLTYALVGEEELELVMARPCPEAPVGFSVRGRSWLLDQADAAYLSSVPGLSEAPRPWPALVTLGRDARGRIVVGDLEAMGLLALGSAEPEPPQAVLAAMAVELSFSPWADEMILTLVGDRARLPEALGKHNVTCTDDLDGLLSRLEHRAAVQREHQPQPVLGQHRIEPDLADPWAPEIVLITTAMSAAQRSRLETVVTAEPRVTMAAVVVDATASAPWSIELPASLGSPGSNQLPGSSDHAGSTGLPGTAAGSAVLHPVRLSLQPQYLDPPVVSAVADLIATTGSELTTPAPWWVTAAEPPDPPPDNVTYLGRRFGGWGSDEDEQAGGARVRAVEAAGGEVRHPTLQLLGPIELLGAAGNPPPRAAKQCLEYCGWLLEHPGSTAQAMANALIVAEGTRRSNMSRLRGWLGSDPADAPYLPDAYTGRIALDPAVSSDWQHLQILTAGGVNRASADGLRAALNLVRGAPLADAAPGQWHWAEELRTDMISCLRDIGLELATRALDAGDIDLARWAAARALVAAPGDELLLATRIRTEHLAGNPAETERLTLQLAAQARALGVDLDEATVVLLQQVMEGRVRARMA